MRGSPVLRFIFLAIALVAVAVGLQRLTSVRAANVPLISAEKTAPSTSVRLVPYRLILSAAAETVKIDTGRKFLPPADLSSLTGTLELNAENPQLSLTVQWKNPTAAGERRFAKLTLDLPGQETFTHVFDAAGDIDDFLELPLATSK